MLLRVTVNIFVDTLILEGEHFVGSIALGYDFCYALCSIGTQAHARVLSSSCGDFYHSESEDRNGYGENLYMCWGTGSGSCYTPERAMTSLCEFITFPLYGASFIS